MRQTWNLDMQHAGLLGFAHGALLVMPTAAAAPES